MGLWVIEDIRGKARGRFGVIFLGVRRVSCKVFGTRVKRVETVLGRMTRVCFERSGYGHIELIPTLSPKL